MSGDPLGEVVRSEWPHLLAALIRYTGVSTSGVGVRRASAQGERC